MPVAQVLGRRVCRYAGHTDRVCQDVAHGRGLFAVGAEFRPQLNKRGVVIERATLCEHVRYGRGRTLAGRVGVEGGVRHDRTPGFVVGDACDGVDHQVTAPVYGDLQTPLDSRLDQLVDDFLDLFLKVFHDRVPI
jgi:hypothetical protein